MAEPVGLLRIASVAAAIALVAAACSPGDSADSTSTSTSTTSTTTTTTSTLAVSTTTTQPTTTSTANTTTTISLPDLNVELTDEGIQAGSTWLPFGSDDDDTVAGLATALGAPSEDTGWLDSFTEGSDRFGVCPVPRVRGVSWGEGGDISLQVLFTDSDTDFWTEGVEHFFTFYYADSSAPSGLTTPEGIGVGSSLGQLKSVYDPAKIVIDEAFFDPAVGFWSYDMADWTGLWGFSTGQLDAHVITSVNGGRGCGE